MYFLIYGNDTYRSRKALRAAKQSFTAKRDSSGLNSVTLRAADDDCDKAAEAIFAAPFLAEKKLVILDGYLRANAAVQERVGEIIAKKPASTAVIFFEDANSEALEKSPLFALFKKQRFSAEYKQISGVHLHRFVNDECSARGCDISPAAARELIAFAGDDSWRLHQEIEKLCAHAAGQGTKTITEDAVQQLASDDAETSIFSFLDACSDGKLREAIALLERLLQSGMSELQIVSMLLRQIRTLIAVSDSLLRGERSKEIIAKKLRLHPFPVGKAMMAVRRYSFDFLRRQYRSLLELDRQFKTGSKSPALLDVFAARFAQGS